MILIKKWRKNMGKRRKRGNHKRKKIKPSDDFFNRERLLNKKINDFVSCFYNLKRPPDVKEYYMMNRKRMDIKTLFDTQERFLSQQSHRRRTIYYEQLGKFKIFYSRWKRYTYYVFLTEVFDVPTHLYSSLSWFKKNKIKNFYVMKNGNL